MPSYLSAILIYFHSLTFVEMSGVLILIEGNDLSAYSNVILTSPVRLKVKVKTIPGPRMANGWQFTSIITITVTYQRRSVRQKKQLDSFKVFSSRWFGGGEENLYV